MADAGNLEKLPLEIRDMIYDLPEMLDHEVPVHCGYETHSCGPCDCPPYLVATRPSTSLLLVNKKVNSEYKLRCEGRSTLFVADHTSCLLIYDENEVKIPEAAAEKVSSVHLHADHLITSDGGVGDGRSWVEIRFKEWLRVWSSPSQVPNLVSFTVILELYHADVQSTEQRQRVVNLLLDLMLVEQLTELKVVVKGEAGRSQGARLPRRLLVDWKRGDTLPPQLIDPMVVAEKCCNAPLY